MVSQYKYLGVMFTSKIHATWVVAQSTLAAQARKALFMLRKCQLKTGALSCDVALKLFRSYIEPICLYASEVWGHSPFDACERVQLSFGKQLLLLPSNTCNLAVYGEIGLMPLKFECYKRCIAYWLKLLDMPNYRFPKACYLMLKRMSESGIQHTWAEKVKFILTEYGFSDTWNAQKVDNKSDFLNMLVNAMHAKYNDLWTREIRNTSKLRTYVMIKSNIGMESYLNMVNDRFLRSSIAKLRCSAHKLNIEFMRSNHTLEERLCPYCEELGSICVEDEYHFVMICPLYHNIRIQYANDCILDQTYAHFLDVLRVEGDSAKNIALLVHKSFKKRKEFIEGKNNI